MHKNLNLICRLSNIINLKIDRLPNMDPMISEMIGIFRLLAKLIFNSFNCGQLEKSILDMRLRMDATRMEYYEFWNNSSNLY